MNLELLSFNKQTWLTVNNLVVTDLRQNSSNLNSVIVQWVNPTDLAAVSSYIVHWSGHQVTDKKAVKSDTSQIELGGFPPGMDYQVTVTTQILHLGQTIASPAIMARTRKYCFRHVEYKGEIKIWNDGIWVLGDGLGARSNRLLTVRDSAKHLLPHTSESPTYLQS